MDPDEPPIDLPAIEALARAAHERQLYGNEPYINHPFRVAAAFSDPLHKAVALLHDVAEDSKDYNINAIAGRFGERIAKAVDHITRRKEGDRYTEDYFTEYLPRVLLDPVATAVKIADVRENLRCCLLPGSPMAHKAASYRAKLTYLEGKMGIA